MLTSNLGVQILSRNAVEGAPFTPQPWQPWLLFAVSALCIAASGALCTLQYSTLYTQCTAPGNWRNGGGARSGNQGPGAQCATDAATGDPLRNYFPRHHFGPLRKNNLFPALLRPPNH